MTLSVLNSFKFLFFLIVSVTLIHQVASQEFDISEDVDPTEEEVDPSDVQDETLGEQNETLDEQYETSDAQDETSDAQDETSDAQDETSDTRDETADAQDETSDAQDETADAQDETADAQDETSDAQDETADAQDETSDAQDETLYGGDNDESDDDYDERTGEVEPLRPPECGYNTYNLQRRKRIVSSFKVGEWPWMGALLGNAHTFFCGASLISSRHVLTAAHCVYGDDGFIVRFGEYDLSDDDDGAIDVPVEKVTIHPDYDHDTSENDIAILELATEIDFTDAIHPICLPVEDDLKNRNYVNDHLFAAGWGDVRYKGSASATLRETHVPVVDEETCLNDYSKFEGYFVIDDRVICAGYREGGGDTCQGDSGGPLVFFQIGYYYLIGIVTSGHHCGEPNAPGLYARVTTFLDFILSNMN